jgi:hypothetical protein
VLLNLAILVKSGLSGVLGTLGRILLSYLVHMHSRLRSLRQGQVHVGPITWEVLPQGEGKRERETERGGELTSGSKSGDHCLQNLGHHGGEREVGEREEVVARKN